MITILFSRLKRLLENFASSNELAKNLTTEIELLDDLIKYVESKLKNNALRTQQDNFDVYSESYSSMPSDAKDTTDVEGTTNYPKTTEKSKISETDIDEYHSQELRQDYQLSQSDDTGIQTQKMGSSGDSVNQISPSPKIMDKDMVCQKADIAKIMPASLSEIQNEISNILDEFESISIPHTISNLADALENLRQTITVVSSNISYIDQEGIENSDSSKTDTSDSSDKVISCLKELVQPILKIREALVHTNHYNASELLLIKQLSQPMQAIEFNILKLALEVTGSVDSEATSNLHMISRIVEDIGLKIPAVLNELNMKQEALEVLHQISVPLNIIKEKLLEEPSSILAQDTIEIVLENILNSALETFKDTLSEISCQIELIEHLDTKNRDAVLSLKNLVDPLVELQSTLCVIKNSRKNSNVDSSLHGERKNVILKAINEIRASILVINDNIRKAPESASVIQTLIDSSIQRLSESLDSVEQQVT